MANNLVVRSSRALNSLLNSYWEDAKYILENTQPADAKDRSLYVLREFELGRRLHKHSSSEDLPFHVRFSPPSLEYICSHELALFLTVESGHINPAAPAYQPDGFSCIDSSKNKTLENLELAYRIQFKRYTLSGRDEHANYPDSPYPVPIIVLHLNTASLVTRELPINKELFQSCMRRFLDTLATNSKGEYVLYDSPKIHGCLPASYSMNHSPKVRSMLEASGYRISVHGFNVEEINGHYKHLWEGSKALEDFDHWSSAGSSDLLLTAYSSDWLPDSGVFDPIGPFVITFGVPKLTALFPHELILTFNIVELYLFEPGQHPDESEPKTQSRAENWKISFIVSIRAVEGGHGVVELDVGPDPVVYEPLSQLGPKDTEEDRQVVMFVIRFFTSHYLKIFKESGYLRVAHPWQPPEDLDPSPPPEVADSPHGFYVSPQRYDHVSTFSERSVNQIFSRRYQESVIEVPPLFDARVQSIYIRLVLPGSAIVYVRCSGSMALENSSASTPRKPWARPLQVALPTSSEVGTTKEPFGSIELAFEVELRMISGSELKHQLAENARDVLFPVDHPLPDTKHLVLDFHTASYSNLNSDIAALNLNPNKLAIARHHITEHLRSLMPMGYHILYSVRLIQEGCGIGQNQTDELFAFREIAYRVMVPDSSPNTAEGGVTSPLPEPPILVICGNCSGGKSKPLCLREGQPLPMERRPITWGVIGTLSFSSDVLLKGVILPRLAALNLHSTVAKALPESVGDEMKFEFEMWRDRNPDQFSAWKEDGCVIGDELQFTWEHTRDLIEKSTLYAAEDSSAEISFHGHSKNTLTVPTGEHGSSAQLKLIVAGKSEISCSSRHASGVKENWSFSSTVKWSCSVAIISSQSSLQVSIELTCDHDGVDDVDATSGRPTNFGTKHCELIRESQRQLKSSLEDDLKCALEGPWKHCTLGSDRFGLRAPVFTHDGGFRCEFVTM